MNVKGSLKCVRNNHQRLIPIPQFLFAEISSWTESTKISSSGVRLRPGPVKPGLNHNYAEAICDMVKETTLTRVLLSLVLTNNTFISAICTNSCPFFQIH